MLVPLITLDLETTGLDPTRHAPWEIAWVTALHDTEVSTLTIDRSRSRMLRLPVDFQFDPMAFRINRYPQRYPQASKHDPIVVLTEMVADIGSIAASGAPAPVHLLGAVPQFDHRMLERWMGWVHGGWHYHLIDVETLLAGSLHMPPPYNTNALTIAMAEILGIEWDSSHMHEAMHDCRWNLHLYAAAYGLRIEGEL